ncbi:MAG: hypothetical protein N2319_07660 [Candidatus Kapabacteria bacterium]|nr:hypothetical protein [Candidatus Kapabacteria bacterium]
MTYQWMTPAIVEVTFHNFPVIPVHTGISSSHRDSCRRRSDISLGKEPPQEQRSRHSRHSLLVKESKKINLDIRIFFIITSFVRCNSFRNTEHRFGYCDLSSD